MRPQKRSPSRKVLAITMVVAKVAAPSLLQSLQTMFGAQGPVRVAPTLHYGMPTLPSTMQPVRPNALQEARRPSVVRPASLTPFIFGGLSQPLLAPALPTGALVAVGPSSMIAQASIVRQPSPPRRQYRWILAAVRQPDQRITLHLKHYHNSRRQGLTSYQMMGPSQNAGRSWTQRSSAPRSIRRTFPTT